MELIVVKSTLNLIQVLSLNNYSFLAPPPPTRSICSVILQNAKALQLLLHSIVPTVLLLLERLQWRRSFISSYSEHLPFYDNNYNGANKCTINCYNWSTHSTIINHSIRRSRRRIAQVQILFKSSPPSQVICVLSWVVLYCCDYYLHISVVINHHLPARGCCWLSWRQSPHQQVKVKKHRCCCCLRSYTLQWWQLMRWWAPVSQPVLTISPQPVACSAA